MGDAYLKDGTKMDYKDYIATHPYWQKVRTSRLKFDNYKCCFCHKDVRMKFETHHLNYDRLGNEHLRDVVTLCPSCHVKFHNCWTRQSFWKGRENGHWDVFDIKHTARMCLMYYQDDYLINKDITASNLCNRDVGRQYVDQYYRDNNLIEPVPIDPHDLQMFVRNKRYELWFNAQDRGLSMEEFLNECYGKKVRGKNPIRRDAGVFFSKHKPQRYRGLYRESKNINLLMEEVKKMEE